MRCGWLQACLVSAVLVIAPATDVPRRASATGSSLADPAVPIAAAPGTSLALASVGTDGGAGHGDSTATRISANGRYVVFQSYSSLRVAASVVPLLSAPSGGEVELQRIYVRDLLTGETSLLSDPDVGASAPDISADGRFVTYQSQVDGDFLVVDRQATGRGEFDTPSNLVARSVTGTPRDLSYERHAVCASNVVGISPTVRACGPRLSADGTTIAYAATLDPAPRTLLVATRNPGDDVFRLVSGNVVDFTPYANTSDYGSAPYSSRDVLDIRFGNHGREPVAFSGLSLVQPPGLAETEPFEFIENGCTAPIAPDGSCTVTVSFNRSLCSDIATFGPKLLKGRLITHAAEPSGQSTLALLGFCFTPPIYAALPSTADFNAACPAVPRGVNVAPTPALGVDNRRVSLVDAGGSELRRPYVIRRVVTAPASSVTGTAMLTLVRSNDTECGIRLVDPTEVGLATQPRDDAPPPCREGGLLASPPPPQTYVVPNSHRNMAPRATQTPPPSCTAYLLIAPDTVNPYAALLGTVVQVGYSSPAFSPDSYVTARGVKSVVVVRRAHNAHFAAAPSTVVSVDSQGAALPGAAQPALSASGRFVAFSAPLIAGRRRQLALEASQVWRHDTDARGDRTYRRGTTTLVSCLPGTRPGRCVLARRADSPGLSSDGNRLVFASSGQVFLRDMSTARSRVVSITSAGTRGNRSSFAPAISDDGTTVAFLSEATNLVRAKIPLGATNLYTRGFAPGAVAVALVPSASLPRASSTSAASIDAHGRMIVFASSAVLARGVPAAVSGRTMNVYALTRFASLRSTPGVADFGTVLIRQRRNLKLTVTNAGPGPATVTALRVSPPFARLADSCRHKLLYVRSTCSITIAFVPRAPGTKSGVMVVNTADDGQPTTATTVTVTATVPAPQLTVLPRIASVGEVVHVHGTGFPPGDLVTVRWSRGFTTSQAVVSRTGSLDARLAVFPRQSNGPSSVVAGTAASPALATAGFLVRPRSQQPPFPNR